MSFNYPLSYVGFVGLMTMVLFTGPHGDTNVAGGFVFLATNTVVYYYVFKFGIYLYRKALSR